MTNKTFAAILMVPALAGALLGQDHTKQALTMAMGANAKQMVSCMWKQRVVVFRHGNPSEPIIEEVRIDAMGQPHHTTLSKPAERRMGPMKARMVASVKEDVQEVMQLARRYANPQQMAQAIQRGEVWDGQGRIRVVSRGVVIPGDDMTMEVNGATYLTTRVDVRTQHEGGPVTIAIDYQQTPRGPSMMSRMTVQIPKSGIVVNVESYDFMRLAGSL